ncbi:MAG: hypothetical protein WC725_03270 [Patescibacteria group bacterium]|jgi:hypothetical protein
MIDAAVIQKFMIDSMLRNESFYGVFHQVLDPDEATALNKLGQLCASGALKPDDEGTIEKLREARMRGRFSGGNLLSFKAGTNLKVSEAAYLFSLTCEGFFSKSPMK